MLFCGFLVFNFCLECCRPSSGLDADLRKPWGVSVPAFLGLGLCSRDPEDATEDLRGPWKNVAELDKVALDAASGLSSSSGIEASLSGSSCSSDDVGEPPSPRPLLEELRFPDVGVANSGYTHSRLPLRHPKQSSASSIAEDSIC